MRCAREPTREVAARALRRAPAPAPGGSVSRLAIGVVLGLYVVGWTLVFFSVEFTWSGFILYVVVGTAGALVLAGVLRAIVWLARWITRPGAPRPPEYR